MDTRDLDFWADEAKKIHEALGARKQT